MELPFQFDYPGIWWVAAGIIGLCVGSFLNVLIYRLPIMMQRAWRRDMASFVAEEREKAGENSQHPSALPEKNASVAENSLLTDNEPPFNLVVPRSACPSCGHKITAWENIPIVSWLFLRGRCSGCHAKISVRYPAVELLGAIVAILAAWHFGATWQAVAAWFFLWTLIAAALIDLDTFFLPDDLTLPLLWAGLLVNYWGLFTTLPDAVLGAVVGYLSLWLVYWAFKLLMKKEGMGYGDFKLLAALGAWMGVKSLLVILLFSSLTGAIIGILLMMRGRHKDAPLPFGPYLAVAGAITFFVGDAILKWLRL
ncbi:MAG: A24 family peptidase [Burkholderiales bacterium]|jgi:leader peptidase (prepilin peptidase)/N-methyltransferase|nr:A24 family peptidase [Burkholderiales bacterium]